MLPIAVYSFLEFEGGESVIGRLMWKFQQLFSRSRPSRSLLEVAMEHEERQHQRNHNWRRTEPPAFDPSTIREPIIPLGFFHDQHIQRDPDLDDLDGWEHGLPNDRNFVS